MILCLKSQMIPLNATPLRTATNPKSSQNPLMSTSGRFNITDDNERSQRS